MMRNRVTNNKLQDLANDLEHAKHSFLRERGWSHSSSNPACIWLWQGVMPDGRVMLVATETALCIQKNMEGIAGKTVRLQAGAA